MAKDLSFLKEMPFFNGGVYDNQQVYENTPTAIKTLSKAGYGLKTNLYMTQDGVVICYKDDNLMRLLHVEDKIKDCTYENINYISKIPILTLNELMNLKLDIPIIFELNKNKTECIIKVMDVLSMYDGKYAIISNDIKTLKWLNKNYPNTIIGYKIDEHNLHKFHIFKKYDFICADVNLYEDKQVRTIRETMMVLGHGIKDDNTYEVKKNVYDNLICDSQLEK